MGGVDPLAKITLIAKEHLQYRMVEEDPQSDRFYLVVKGGCLDHCVVSIVEILSPARSAVVDLNGRLFERKGHDGFFRAVRGATHLQAALGGVDGLYLQLELQAIALNLGERHLCIGLDCNIGPLVKVTPQRLQLGNGVKRTALPSGARERTTGRLKTPTQPDASQAL